MTKRITDSSRLYLREITLLDLDFVTDLHQDAEVMRFIGPPKTNNQVEARLHRIISTYQEKPGFGIWVACLKKTDEPIGWAYLKDLDG